VRQVGQLPRIIAWCTVNETLKITSGVTRTLKVTKPGFIKKCLINKTIIFFGSNYPNEPKCWITYLYTLYGILNESYNFTWFNFTLSRIQERHKLAVTNVYWWPFGRPSRKL